MQNNKLAQTKTSLVVLPGVPAPPLAPALLAERTNELSRGETGIGVGANNLFQRRRHE